MYKLENQGFAFGTVLMSLSVPPKNTSGQLPISLFFMTEGGDFALTTLRAFSVLLVPIVYILELRAVTELLFATFCLINVNFSHHSAFSGKE